MENQEMNVENQGLFDEIIPSHPINDGSDDEDDILIVYMDLKQSLNVLRQKIEDIIGLKLTDYTIWLQESQIVSISF